MIKHIGLVALVAVLSGCNTVQLASNALSDVRTSIADYCSDSYKEERAVLIKKERARNSAYIPVCEADR